LVTGISFVCTLSLAAVGPVHKAAAKHSIAAELNLREIDMCDTSSEENRPIGPSKES
jgi:hypothetical protein